MLTQFLARLRQVLDRVVDAHPGTTYVWKPYEMLADVAGWLASLLDLSTEVQADPACGGAVLFYEGSRYVVARAHAVLWRSLCSVHRATCSPFSRSTRRR